MEFELNNYINDTESGYTNFNLAKMYYNCGQTAAAISFFLRAAERFENELYQYTSLLMLAKCFTLQKDRNFTVTGLLQKSVSLIPDRPEAYYLLANHYEKLQKWDECYMISNIGLKITDFDVIDLPIDVGYPGKYALLFELAVSSWWIGQCHKSRDIFYELKNDNFLDHAHRKSVEWNIENVISKLQ